MKPMPFAPDPSDANEHERAGKKDSKLRDGQDTTLARKWQRNGKAEFRRGAIC
jgi:hypothetical protein